MHVAHGEQAQSVPHGYDLTQWYLVTWHHKEQAWSVPRENYFVLWDLVTWHYRYACGSQRIGMIYTLGLQYGHVGFSNLASRRCMWLIENRNGRFLGGMIWSRETWYLGITKMHVAHGEHV